MKKGKGARNMANVLIPYYSSYGHIYKMTEAVAAGAKEAGADVKVVRIPEFEATKAAMSAQEAYVQAQEAQKDVPEATHDDLVWADRHHLGHSHPLRKYARSGQAVFRLGRRTMGARKAGRKGDFHFHQHRFRARGARNDNYHFVDSIAPFRNDLCRVALRGKSGAAHG